MEIKRICSLINVNKDSIEDYERVHAAVWPEVLACLKRANIQNYSIYRYNNLLVSYMEYIGKDLEADMASIAADPKTQEWWDVCMPLQRPVADRADGEWWASIPEVFHVD